MALSFRRGGRQAILQSTRLEVYKRSLEIVETYFKDEDNRQGFLTIDRRWAKEALGQYRKLKK